MHPALAPFFEGLSHTGDVRADMIATLTHHGCPKTAGHCMRVAEEAKRLARRFGEDEAKTEIAGWLHDISAIIPNNQRIIVAERLGLDVLDEERQLPMIVHQKLSAVITEQAFGVSDQAILSAIGCHTTLKANALRLDKVVFVADKIAWDQPGDPPYLAEITAAVEQSLDEAALCYIEYLWQRRSSLKVVHP